MQGPIRNRLPVQGSRLILPQQHGLERRIHEQRVPAHHARLDDIPVFINHRIDNHRAPNVRGGYTGSAEYVWRGGSICEPTRTIFCTGRGAGGGVGADVPVPPRTPPIWPPITPPGTPPSTPPKSGAASPTLSEPAETVFGIAVGAVSFCSM